MKLKNIIFVFLASIFILNGCHDSFLEEKVYSNITPLNFYKTEQDAKAALTSVYNAMRSSSSFQRQIILAGEYPSEATWNNFSVRHGVPKWINLPGLKVPALSIKSGHNYT